VPSRARNGYIGTTPRLLVPRPLSGHCQIRTRQSASLTTGCVQQVYFHVKWYRPILLPAVSTSTRPAPAPIPANFQEQRIRGIPPDEALFSHHARVPASACILYFYARGEDNPVGKHEASVGASHSTTELFSPVSLGSGQSRPLPHLPWPRGRYVVQGRFRPSVSTP
jgi:hypothetical protein